MTAPEYADAESNRIPIPSAVRKTSIRPVSGVKSFSGSSVVTRHWIAVPDVLIESCKYYFKDEKLELRLLTEALFEIDFWLLSCNSICTTWHFQAFQFSGKGPSKSEILQKFPEANSKLHIQIINFKKNNLLN